MITSDKQYQASKDQLVLLRESFNAPVNEKIPEVVRAVGQVQLQDLIDEVQQDIEEYEKLKNSDVEEIPVHSIQDLLVAPIRYRIASHMSVDAFSRKVGISARQIHRYEAAFYKNSNTSTLTKILEKLDLKIEGHWNSKDRDQTGIPQHGLDG